MRNKANRLEELFIRMVSDDAEVQDLETELDEDEARGSGEGLPQ